MINAAPQKRASGATLKHRRQEIERCLVAFGFGRGSRRPLQQPGVGDHGETQSRRLCLALESLGPVFAAFGLYLSSRVDLLPVHDCLELATIADQAEATSFTTIREVIAHQLGGDVGEMYARFEEAPFESRLLFQLHRAWLHNGKAVTVRVVHPELLGQCACDLESLPVLQHALTGPAWSNVPLAHVIADFRRVLLRRINLSHEADAFEALARDAHEFEMLQAPMVYKDLCASQVITIEHLSGVNLKETLASWEHGKLEDSLTLSTGTARVDLARRLSLVWLRQALLGHQFPVEWCPEDIVVLPTQQIACTGGAFMSLPSEAQRNLWHYLIAASTEDPDKACSCLLREMTVGRRHFKEEELRHRFREIVPFRDGGWSRSGDSNSLAEHLFVHWQLASQRGLRSQPYLLGFYRGLFQTAALSRRLAPYHDPLLDGLQDVRTIAMLAQFGEMMELSQLSANVDKYTAVIMAFPQKLDEVLRLVAEGRPWLKVRGTGAARRRRQNPASTVVVALLLVLAAVVLLSQHLARSADIEVWIDKISAVVFVLLGALLLRAVSRA